MTRTRALAGAGCVAALALTATAFDTVALGRPGSGQAALQYRPVYSVTFQVTQSAKTVGPTTDDQLTILFSNRSAEGPAPPRPFFGEDIVQEFSFSGVDFVGNQLRFTRRVSDKSFLDARYIRVVNYGSDGWEGDRISLVVDGQDILRNVQMTRIGPGAARGMQKFNPREWGSRSYWEGELGQYRRSFK
jgi:hypothetical protein